VTILELRSSSAEDRNVDLSGILMGSMSSLHAKTFAIEGQRIFIGSFNFDPRSAALNTEMGVLIESPRIAAALSEALDARDMVFEVARGSDGSMNWHELTSSGEVVVHASEPQASLFRRAFAMVVSWLAVQGGGGS